MKRMMTGWLQKNEDWKGFVSYEVLSKFKIHKSEI